MKKIYLLQIGLAFVLLYAGIDSFRYPDDWIGFVPKAVNNYGLTRQSFLQIHAAAEILLGVWLLSNWKIRLVSFLVALDLAAIIIVNGLGRSVFLITFRDVGLLFAALYLSLVARRRDY